MSVKTLTVTLSNLRLLDSETASAYNRIAALLNHREVNEETASMVDVFDVEDSVEVDVAFLSQRIFALERENAILRYMSQNTGFDAENAVAVFKGNIERQLASGELKAYKLPKTYGFKFFQYAYHPDYVYALSQFLIDTCSLHGLDAGNPVWQDLLATYGLVSDAIIEKYEVDEEKENNSSI